jgi:holo-[acyl-carrier protein] synthase
MILGVGTDIVKVDRFKSWLTLDKEKFLHIFSKEELKFCLKNEKLDLQSLASRFAAKEAFYKALSSALIKLNLNKKDFYFFFSCKNVEILKEEWGVPKFKINWFAFENKIGIKIPNLNVDLSISHEKEYAVAFVVISK